MGQNLIFRMVLIVFLTASTAVFAHLLQMNENNAEANRRLTIMFPLSVYVLFSVCYAANIEIIGVFFFLCSLLLLLQKKKIFCLPAIFSIALYPVCFLLYMIVILLFHKKIGRIFTGILIIGAPGAILYMILSRTVLSGIGNIVWADTLSHGFPILEGNHMSFFAVGFIAALAAAYFTPEEKRKEMLFYYLMSSVLILAVFASYHSYYMVIAVPLILLVFQQRPAYLRTNLILYLVYSVSGIVCMIWNDEGYILRRILSDIRNIEYYIGAAAACMAASAVLMIVVNSPFYKSKSEVMTMECEKWLIWIAALAGCPFIVLSVL